MFYILELFLLSFVFRSFDWDALKLKNIVNSILKWIIFKICLEIRNNEFCNFFKSHKKNNYFNQNLLNEWLNQFFICKLFKGPSTKFKSCILNILVEFFAF